ncbi:hypothetical protein [Celeribacter sp.]|uniref:hypothetical protein n=1 Tax=Celeribacter sp. TaxID=1890673 RepID=UPI003A8E6985
MDLSQSPVDELATLRRKITELRVRERMLEAAFLQTRDTGVFCGYRANVRIERSMQDVFDITKLPARILDDPQFQSTRVVTKVRVEPRFDAPLHLSRDTANGAQTAHTTGAVIDHDARTAHPRRITIQ